MLELLEHLAEVVPTLGCTHHQELTILWILTAECREFVALQAEGEYKLSLSLSLIFSFAILSLYLAGFKLESSLLLK